MKNQAAVLALSIIAFLLACSACRTGAPTISSSSQTNSINVELIDDLSEYLQEKMILIEGGTMQRGIREFTLDNYYIGKTEVTQGLFASVMGDLPVDKWLGTDYPVNELRWYETIVFCNRLSMAVGLTPAYNIDGTSDPALWGPVPDEMDPVWDSVVLDMSADGYRLPTDAEWIYAAREGQNNSDYTYAGSDSLDEVGWYWRNSGDEKLEGEWSVEKVINNNLTVHPVAQKQPNQLGLYDMSGNVQEMLWNWLGHSPEGKNPTGPEEGSARVIRGGGFAMKERFCAIGYRSSGQPHLRGHEGTGFRIARSYQP